VSNTEKGVFYVVATPLGNREDLSQRARRVLSDVGLIAAEDTRHTGRLLSGLGIKCSLRSLHEHNELRVVAEVLEYMAKGGSVALVSDAGTPLISDPGYQVVKACHEAGFRVVPVPGPCAAIAALSAGGLPTDSFRFCGFLPRGGAARRERLRVLGQERATLVFYEAPHRIEAMLTDLVAVFGAVRLAVLARELTKVHETVIRAPLGALLERVSGDPEQRLGEMVVLVEGAPDPGSDADSPETDRQLRLLLEYLPVKQAAAALARLTGLKKNALYRRAVALQSKTSGAE
jgi:16S rRNA (cytidine1402-2'-O)-methyltransferase